MLLLAEYSHSCIQFWKYEDCENSIKEAFDLSGIEIDLAGKLGRLTKFQTFDTACLILDIHSKDVEMKTLQVSDNKEDEEKSKLYVDHGDDSILLEKPNFAEAEKIDETPKAPDLSKLDSADLSNEFKIVIQAFINYLFCSLPDKDEHTYEQIRPYIMACVAK